MDKSELQRWYDQNKKKYEDLVKTLEYLVKRLLEENQIPYHSVNGRVKGKENCVEKFSRKSYETPEQMMDFAGLRIITHTTEEVEQVCNMIEREFQVDSENSGDKAADMDVNQIGYLSVHYVVTIRSDRIQFGEYARLDGLRCEIQVRSLLQHAWAEMAHDHSYKFSGKLPQSLERRFYLIAGVLELMDQEFRALSHEMDLYKDDVKEKTAQGQLENVAIDSTSLLQFLNDYFKDFDTEALARNFQKGDNVIIGELSSFGIQTLQQLKELLIVKPAEDWLVGKMTYIGLLREAMILKSPKAYFDLAWEHHCQITSHNMEALKKIGVDMRELKESMKQHGLVVDIKPSPDKK